MTTPISYRGQIFEKCKRVWIEEVEKYPKTIQNLFFNSKCIIEFDNVYKVKTFISNDKIIRISWRLLNSHEGYIFEYYEECKILNSFTNNQFQGLQLGVSIPENISYFSEKIDDEDYGPIYNLTDFTIVNWKFYLFGKLISEKELRTYLSDQKKLTFLFLENILLQDLLNIVFEYLKLFCDM